MFESKNKCLHALFKLPKLLIYMLTSAEAAAMTDASGPLGPPANAKAFFKRSYSVEVKMPKKLQRYYKFCRMATKAKQGVLLVMPSLRAWSGESPGRTSYKTTLQL